MCTNLPLAIKASFGGVVFRILDLCFFDFGLFCKKYIFESTNLDLPDTPRVFRIYRSLFFGAGEYSTYSDYSVFEFRCVVFWSNHKFLVSPYAGLRGTLVLCHFIIVCVCVCALHCSVSQILLYTVFFLDACSLLV